MMETAKTKTSCENEDAQSEPFSLTSLDGRLELKVSIGAGSKPTRFSRPEVDCLLYEVFWEGEPCILPSRLGLGLAGEPPLVNHFGIIGCHRKKVEGKLPVLHGEQADLDLAGEEMLLELEEKIAPGRRLNVRFRTFQDAVAFRYEIPRQPGFEKVAIENEQTCFRFPDGCRAWETGHAQGRYQSVPVEELGDGVERPLTVEYPSGIVASVAEAGMLDHPRAKFTSEFGFDRLTMKNPGPGTVLIDLHGPATGSLPWAGSWRVIFLASHARELIGRSDLLKALCPPPDFECGDWVRPGKCMRVMKLSTEAGLAAVEFAAENGLEFIEFDVGWYGNAYEEGSDPTSVSVGSEGREGEAVSAELDLAKVIAAGRERGVGVFLYVDRRHLERHLERLLPIYQKWGVAGIKFGFVQVGLQEWASWLHRAVRRCADFGLLVNIHDEYRPTGLSGTFPNLLTQEGICGNEEMPSPAHNVTLPFTRFIAGAADYTICHRFSNKRKGLQTTPAHQLAMAAVYFSPMQFLFWYGSPEENAGLPELEWYRRIPTVWEQTIGVAGEIGQYVAVARRAGRTWFLGAMTNSEPRALELRLDFLNANLSYRARIFSDSEEAQPGQATPVRISEQTVTWETVLRQDLSGSGGLAVILEEMPGTS